MFVSTEIEILLKIFSQEASWNDLFGNSNPIELEICSGKDEFLIRMAEREPEINFIGIERSLPISKKLISKIERSGLPNIRVIVEDASIVLEECFQPSEIQSIYINFPDPWPKRRHHKKRLITPSFTQLMVERLAQEGTIQFVSDYKDYVEWTLPIFENNTELANECGNQKWAHFMEDFPPTLFMQKYQREGRAFYFLKFKKKFKLKS